MAAAALLLALKIKLRGGWTPTLQYYSGVIFDNSKLSWQNIYHKFLVSSSGHDVEVFHKKNGKSTFQIYCTANVQNTLLSEFWPEDISFLVSVLCTPYFQTPN
jgi:hypothetical protein